MLFDFLRDYATILIFLFISIGIGFAFILANFLFSPSNPDPENYLPMNVVLKLLMTLE